MLQDPVLSLLRGLIVVDKGGAWGDDQGTKGPCRRPWSAHYHSKQHLRRGNTRLSPCSRLSSSSGIYKLMSVERLKVDDGRSRRASSQPPKFLFACSSRSHRPPPDALIPLFRMSAPRSGCLSRVYISGPLQCSIFISPLALFHHKGWAYSGAAEGLLFVIGARCGDGGGPQIVMIYGGGTTPPLRFTSTIIGRRNLPYFHHGNTGRDASVGASAPAPET